MKPSVHLKRANGYREMEMYDDALRELDMIGEEDCDSNLAVKAKWQVYRDSDDSFMAEKTSRVMVERYPENLSWRLHQANAIFCDKGAKAAYELMLSEQERFKSSAKYFFSLGRYAALAGLWVQAKKFACISGQLDGNFTQAFIDEVAFEPLWRNRVANPWSLTSEAGAFNFKKALRALRRWLEQESEDE